jgi:hypothetical protein
MLYFKGMILLHVFSQIVSFLLIVDTTRQKGRFLAYTVRQSMIRIDCIFYRGVMNDEAHSQRQNAHTTLHACLGN